MRQQDDLNKQFKINENLIESLRLILSKRVPKAQIDTPQFYIFNHFLKEKLIPKDYELLYICSQLDYLQGENAALQYALNSGVFLQKNEEARQILNYDDSSPIPAEIQHKIISYHGLHRDEISRINASLWLAYSKNNKEDIAKFLAELNNYTNG